MEVVAGGRSASSPPEAGAQVSAVTLLAGVGTVPAEGKVLTDELSEQIELFLRHLTDQRRVAPNTVAAYGNDLRQFSEYLRLASPEGAPQLTDGSLLDPGTVAGFVLHLREKGYAQATVARKVAAVKSFVHYAAEAGVIPNNPAAGVDSPRVHRAAPQAVDPSDVSLLLEVGCAGDMPDDLRDRAMLTLLYHSGMRVSELVALNDLDVDFEGSSISCRGRGGRVRSIPLTNEACLVLQDYLANGRPFLARGDGLNGGPSALFLNHRGTRLTRQGFWLIMRERARVAGVESPMTPHALRHSFALHHLGTGTPLRDLKELLGHVNISTTQIYTLVERAERAPV
jgi:integrase/recombinase XerD